LQRVLSPEADFTNLDLNTELSCGNGSTLTHNNSVVRSGSSSFLKVTFFLFIYCLQSYSRVYSLKLYSNPLHHLTRIFVFLAYVLYNIPALEF